MKKTLLFIAFLLSCNFLSAQTLLSDNFNSLIVGNIGTDLTGVTAGQNGWYTFNSAGGTNSNNSNYQIVNNDATHLKVVQITGSDAATGTKYLWKDGLATAWGGRTPGNNIIEVEFDFNPGAATTSTNSFRVYLYNTDGTKILAGLAVAMNTLQVSGVIYADNAGTLGNYGINLGAPAPTLTANTWVRMGMSFNKTTGQVIWRGPGFNGSFTGAGAATDPAEVDFVVSAGTANAVAAVGLYDNFITKATNTDTLLGTENFNTISTSKLSVYPNPVNNIVNISNTENLLITKVSITDINGRTVKTVNTDGVVETQINVAELNAGIYFMNIDTNEGAVTKKIIKN